MHISSFKLKSMLDVDEKYIYDNNILQ